MNAMLIACEMLEDEILLSMERNCCRYTTQWVGRQLHLSPKKLYNEVQDIIDKHTGYDTILLAMAQCGNALVGLKSTHSTLIIPRFPDCLHMLQSMKNGDKGSLDIRTIYLTKGWLEGERSTLSEYSRFEASHGSEKAHKAYQSIFSGYQQVCLINTGAFDAAEAAVDARKTADILDLSYTETPGTTRILDKLLTGQWDEEFLVAPPGKQIRYDY